MWMEKKSGKYKYTERYIDPLTESTKRISITLSKKNDKLALQCLQEKITSIVNQQSQEYTFSYVADKYIAFQKKNVKPSTYERDLRFCIAFEQIIDKNALMNKLNARYIKDCLDATGKSNRTKNEYLKRFKPMIRWAYRNDYIDDIQWLDKLTNYKDASAHEKVMDKYIEPDEVHTLLNGMNHNLWRLLTEFLVLSGLRIGEAIALEKKDIELDNRIIHITKTYDKINDIITTPKTAESNRDIFIQDELYTCIKKIYAYNRLMDISSIYVFSQNGNMVKYDTYRQYLGDYSDRLLKRRITPHTLRHTHASMLLASGMQIDAISRRLGHADSKVTREIYLHVMDKLKERDRTEIMQIKLL